MLSALLILAVVGFGVSYFMRGELPMGSEILPEMYLPPVQQDQQGEEFSFEYRNREYFVQPLADYELHGVVVSHNDITAIWDIYHDKDSVDIKDLCVVWGDNLRSGDLDRVDIHNQAWTCFYRYGPGVEFHPFQLANNHILSDDKHVRDVVRSVRVGDQIRAQGMLVDYGETPGEYYRKTSMTREDTNSTARAGGACEVFFVEEIDVLQRATPGWYLLSEWSKKAILIILVLKVVLFFVTGYLESRRPSGN